MKNIIFILKTIFLSIFTFGCRPETPPSKSPPPEITFDGHHNLQKGCVENGNSDTDYFPEKIRVEDAAGFQVSYHKTYKKVTLTRPWRQTNKQFTYLLVQCGTPQPTGVSADAIITIPIQRVITTSTTQLPAFEQLGLIESVAGHAGLSFIAQAKWKERIEKGLLREVGATELNLEAILALKPDLVFTYAMGQATDAHLKLAPLGLNAVLNTDYTETTPLGRTEWLKFTALFFNQEAKATALYQGIRERYQAVLAKTTSFAPKPPVFTGNAFQGNWYIAGKQGFIAKFLMDAGGQYAFPQETQNLTLNIEGVLQYGAKAEVWIGTSPFKTQAEALSQDERYKLFQAIQQKRYYYYDGSLFESAIAEPDRVLSDLQALLYPTKFPNHSLRYFTQMQ